VNEIARELVETYVMLRVVKENTLFYSQNMPGMLIKRLDIRSLIVDVTTNKWYLHSFLCEQA